MANLAKGKTRIIVTLPDRVVERLNEVAEEKGITKSVLITLMADELYPSEKKSPVKQEAPTE